MSYRSKNIVVFILLLFTINSKAQDYLFSGSIKDKIDNTAVYNAEIYNENGKLLSASDSSGHFEFYSTAVKLDIVVFTERHEAIKKSISNNNSKAINILLKPLSVILKEVEIIAKKQELFSVNKLADVVETSIYAGRKSEVINLNKTSASLALNNSRQIYSQVSGLNIYQNDDAGLQLHIGGRGLDPNRTSNFNARKNGYDISADVLGYPESYYTPPAEALQKIEIIRGAGALQYGTQFGGLINFIIKNPISSIGKRGIYRSSIGSNKLTSHFLSFTENNDTISYYAFLNYKDGNGFRENSKFNSKNSYLHISKKLNKKLTISFEITLLEYLAQQPGGLNDLMFQQNPLQSNRSRNWFKVNWFLYNTKLKYQQNLSTLHTINVFGLDAERYALGYRSNRVAQTDPLEERDLIYGDFKNYGIEYRRLYNTKIYKLKTINLFGVKLYSSNNTSIQGAGEKGSEANFNFANATFPNYPNQSSYAYPNKNLALFGEQIIYVNENISITPGLRLEYINTKSNGWFKKMLVDNANNVISEQKEYSVTENERSFIIFGISSSYKIKKNTEFYTNLCQNYRSVTFADMSIVNPAFVINPKIEDEKGYTFNIGARGNIDNIISYDINSFYLMYKKRIGFIQKLQDDGNVKSERGNVGDARISGIESLISLSLNKFTPNYLKSNIFLNTALIQSEYIRSETNGIEGNTVEFIPNINLKTGIRIAYKSLTSNLQLTYLSSQFTDATNAIGSNLSGVIGEIPKYDIIDWGIKWRRKNYRIEAGINNLLNKSYFTRRATGYPGPGIIPSPTRNYYATLELNF